MEDVDIHDIEELNNLAKERDNIDSQLADKLNLLANVKCEVIKLDVAITILKEAKKNMEENIRIKKLSINLKPRGEKW